jgi:hypothetical protein
LVDSVGFTFIVPAVLTCPTPSIDTSVAFVLFHVSTALSPGLIAEGVTVITAVGAGAATVGGGGGGGAGGFL